MLVYISILGRSRLLLLGIQKKVSSIDGIITIKMLEFFLFNWPKLFLKYYPRVISTSWSLKIIIPTTNKLKHMAPWSWLELPFVIQIVCLLTIIYEYYNFIRFTLSILNILLMSKYVICICCWIHILYSVVRGS